MNAADEVAKMWGLFPLDADAPIHLRGIWPKGIQVSKPPINLIFTPAEYSNPLDRMQAFADAAITRNAEGYNIYTCFNPILPGHTANSVGDADIRCRNAILIDIDRLGSLVASATDDEITAAEKMADKVTSYLFEERGLSVSRVMSGNGVHLYLPLDAVPNDCASNRRCKQFLKYLATRFDNDFVKVDTAVFNASRITKVPGTMMRKGIETVDRPHRMAHVV